MTTRLTRPQQVERNRTLLLDAARRTFLARGYAGATIDAIAEEAGFSKGVVYSQFSGKADLFLALLAERVDWRAAENDRLVEDHPGPGALIALMRTSERRTTEDAGWARLLIEFRVAAARDPELNRRYAALHAHSVTRLAGAIAAATREGRRHSGLPAARLRPADLRAEQRRRPRAGRGPLRAALRPDSRSSSPVSSSRH